MVATRQSVAALALLAVLLGSSFLLPLQQHAFLPEFRPAPQGFKPVGTDSFKVFFDALLRLPKSIVSFFMMDGSATDKFLVMGAVGCDATALTTDSDCWSLSSGGAGGAGVPGPSDTARLNGASGAGTGDICSYPGPTDWNSGAFIMTGFAGTIIMSDSSGCTFSGNTETVNGDFIGGGTMLIGDTADLRVRGNWSPGGALTISGTVEVGTCTGAAVNFNTGAYTYIGVVMCGDVTLVGSLTTNAINPTFSLIVNGGGSGAGEATGRRFITNGFSVTVAGTGDFYLQGGGIFDATGGSTITINGAAHIGVSFGGALCSAVAIRFGSGAWTVHGGWSDSYCGPTSTGADDANWQAGTGTITFDDPTSVGVGFQFEASTVHFNEFNNVVFQSSSGAARTFTMSAGTRLQYVNALTISDSSSTTSLSMGGSGRVILGANLTIASGGILSTSSSVVVISNTFDSSVGTLTAGTGTVKFTGGSTGFLKPGASTFYNIRVTGMTVNITGSSLLQWTHQIFIESASSVAGILSSATHLVGLEGGINDGATPSLIFIASSGVSGTLRLGEAHLKTPLIRVTVAGSQITGPDAGALADIEYIELQVGVEGFGGGGCACYTGLGQITSNGNTLTGVWTYSTTGTDYSSITAIFRDDSVQPNVSWRGSNANDWWVLLYGLTDGVTVIFTDGNGQQTADVGSFGTPGEVQFNDPVALPDSFYSVVGPAAGGPGTPAPKLQVIVCGNTVTLTDTSPEASSAILYQWNFGDGTSATTTSGNVTHTYPAAGTYNGTVAVQYRSGAIQQYFFVTTTGTCNPLTLLAQYGLDILAVLVLLSIFLLIVFRRSKGRRWKRIAIAIVVGGVVILFAAFAVFGRLPFQ